MEGGWTLHVEDFGPIERADVEISPLTFFVGDNNSGKSYLMALIYWLVHGEVMPYLWYVSPEYQACADWMKVAFERAKKAEVSLLFGEEEYVLFENLLNQVLNDEKADILKYIFQSDISAGVIRVTFQKAEKVTIKISSDGLDIHVSFSFWGVQFNFIMQEHESNASFLIPLILSGLLMCGAFQSSGGICFLPTARTGFMLSYPALVQDAFSRVYRQSKGINSGLSLTMPCTDFLESLAAVKEQEVNKKYLTITDLIENKIIRGKIHVSNKLPLPSFSYQPEQSDRKFPLYLVSDVVKETTPLILALKYQSIGGLFIEEPELSLHPALQQQMARVLVKLANAGLPVVAATHSDIIIQHVNNMVKLSRLPEARQKTLMDRYGFDADDPIPAEKVSLYQFDVQDSGRTAVRRLSCGDYGFETPTYYKPLEGLMDQSRDTEPDAEEYENT